jgi:hypothetical protein
VDEVEFWASPDHAGWLQSQGDHIKTWRRRWHVLKQGHLFRFASPAEGATRTARPRGVVDLSQVTDVAEARAATGRDCSLRLATATGAELCYLADSETEQVEWLSLEEWNTARRSFLEALDQWRADWESRDTDKYLRHYSGKFAAGKHDLAAWAQQKRGVNAGKSWIKVGIDHVSVFLYPGNDNLAVLSFEQDYASSNVSNKMRKRQYWQREGNTWRIVHEGAA